jgi:hypothetical protein
MVVDEVCHTPTTITSIIVLFPSKTFLSYHLFNENGKVLMELFKGEKLCQILLKFTPLCSPGIHNLIISLKHRPSNSNSLDCTLKLKAQSSYNYIQDNYFHGQHVGQKVYLFKMSVDGVISEFDLVREMQLGDDLQNVWMMLNHVKHVQGWTTMACHVYDPIYCKVMTIVICDTQFEDTKAQCILWRKLNTIVEKKKVGYTRL